jgi:non-canonical (house-cleaning) NTP pyrophosphatase
MHVSSQSPIKLEALHRAMVRAGHEVNVVGYTTASGVNEQPLSLDETVRGATNRHAQLQKISGAAAGEYLATIESGNDTLHAALGFRGLSIVIIERVGGVREMGLDVDVEFPPEIVELVPAVYPDFGVMMQQRYGSELKDPYPLITGGTITRAMLLEDAAYRVALQL